MAYGSGRQHETRYQAEVTFATIVDADWSDGITFLCVEPDVTQFKRAVIENMNYRQRVLATRPIVHSLANGEMNFGLYPHGRRTVVADAARATVSTPEFPIARFMQNAWGGLRLGWRAASSTGTASAPVVTAGQGVQYAAGDVVFAIDNSAAGRGFFRKIASIAVDTLTMWGGHALPYTPGAGDFLGAVIKAYPHRSILVNPNHASHTTHSFLRFGELADDVQQAVGVKLNLASIEGLAAGEAGILRFTGLCTQVVKEGITAPTPAEPIGDPPLATSTGADTIVSISVVGSALAAVEAQSVTVTPGIASQPIPGVGGVEGRHGYTLSADSADAPMIEVTVDYDDSWSAGFIAGTRYQILIQVGTTAGEAYAVFAAETELVEDPERNEATDLSVSVLKFRCLESSVVTAATGDALESVRAKIELWFSCATA